MKKLIRYELFMDKEAYELEKNVRWELNRAERENEKLERQGETYRLKIELLGGAFYGRERYCQTILTYKVSEEAE